MGSRRELMFEPLVALSCLLDTMGRAVRMGLDCPKNKPYGSALKGFHGAETCCG